MKKVRWQDKWDTEMGADATASVCASASAASGDETTGCIRLKDADTDIWIGAVLPRLKTSLDEVEQSEKKIYFCSDEVIWPKVRPLLKEHGLAREMARPSVCFLPGEAHKQIDQVARGWEALAQGGADRHGVVLNVGGGVVGDMGGFMAATYKRGIKFIQVPTSLLAMVDASVGGKTGVDVGEVKNMAGLFVRPHSVYIDPRFLKTLPKEEYDSGVAEIIKMQLLFKPDFSLQDAEGLFKHVPVEVIASAVKAKCEVVEMDFDEKGPRRLLNFGHTFGHAFESWCMAQGRPVPHGRAVAWGMVYELYLSVKKLGFDEALFRKIRDMLTLYYCKPTHGAADRPACAAYLQHDKKNRAGEVGVVLLAAPGEGHHQMSIPLHEAEALLQDEDTIYSF